MQKLVWLLPFAFIATCNQTVLAASTSNNASAAGRSFYVDCTAGKDAAEGTTAAAPLRTLAQVNALKLLPGDHVLLKRGCTFAGPLVARSSGTASAPIRYTSYGAGTNPAVQLTTDAEAVLASGNHLVFNGLSVTSARPSVPSTAGKCSKTPVGWRVGFEVAGQYNTVQNSSASGFTAGIHLSAGNNKVLHNKLTNNNVMKKNTAGVFDDDSGAWGVLVNSDNNEIAGNTFGGNWACSEDYGKDGASVELYEASSNNIHDNVSTEDPFFTELGGTPKTPSKNNTFAYNTYAPVKSGGAMIVLRGTKSKWGGNPGTVFHHNVGYMVDMGIICSDGCGPSILKAYDNVLWQRDTASGLVPAAKMTPMWADAPFTEYNNVFWKKGGRPYVSIDNGKLSATDRIADPLFVNALALDFTRQPATALLASAPVRR
ncbi:hypothetical protein [Deinococcus hopiensis]|uniref:Parallel beta-helix repeat (Two copies) n=1 Tax=Deinococcus hopiensis KR-140 TaxID=695939 RepID=A0A1W1VV13_9DEIO|nr:hypothetical protein [Deinococcus hopiensis]SMB97198.1 hypothetical protein SAMN00790413_06409 [Deinococcus hopiensis KR-140]